jgi:lysophospholipase L1-like esterase
LYVGDIIRSNMTTRRSQSLAVNARASLGTLLNQTELTRNTDIVEIGGYATIENATFNGGLVTAGRSYVNMNNITKVRQSETITKISFAKGASSNMTSIFFDVWRKDGATYDNVCHIDITSIASGNGILLLDITPTAVLEGDFIGISGTSSVTTGDTTFDLSAAAGNAKYSSSAIGIVTGNDVDIASLSTFTNNIVPIKVFGQAPLIIPIGDSNIAGRGGYDGGLSHYSFREISEVVNMPNQIWHQMKLIDAAYVYQNMGIGSQTTTNIKDRFTADCVNLKPKVAIINGGVNDISGGVITKATFLSNWTTILNACVANNIVPVCLLIWPWTDGTNAQNQTRDEWNTDLSSLIATYNTAIKIDCITLLGQTRVGGDEGNLWDLKTEYDYDGVHINLVGKQAVAALIDSEIKKKYKFA